MGIPIPNLFAEKQPKEEGAAIEKWGKIYSALYILSVMAGVVGIVGSIAMGGSDTIQYEPRGYDATKASTSSVSFDKVNALKADPNKKDVTCHCKPRPDSVVYTEFMSAYQIPQYKLCDADESNKDSILSVNFEECMKYKDWDAVAAAGAVCPPGLVKDKINKPDEGALGQLNADGVTKFVDWMQSQCKLSRKLIDTIVSNALATVVDEDSRLVEKDVLSRKIKALILSGYNTAQPLWESQLYSHKMVSAFNSPAQVVKVTGDTVDKVNGVVRGDLSVAPFTFYMPAPGPAPGPDPGSCTDNDAKIAEDSKDQIADCATGVALGWCDDAVATAAQAPAGWFIGHCCASCARRRLSDDEDPEPNSAFYAISAPSAMAGSFPGFDKIGLWMGDIAGTEVGWDETKEGWKDTSPDKRYTYTRGQNHPMEAFFGAGAEASDGLQGKGLYFREILKLEETATSKNPWLRMWRSMLEVGTEGNRYTPEQRAKGSGRWLDAAKDMYMDMSRILDENGELQVKVDDSQYDDYFTACAPTHCTFIQHQGVDPNVMIVAVLGSFGGLMSGLKLAFQVLFMIHKMKLKPKKSKAAINPAETAATNKAPAPAVQQPTVVQPAVQGVREIPVVVPAGAQPGMSMSVNTPAGSTMVVIPVGAVPGQTIMAKY